ncbi:AAA family ATPase [Vibrio sp. AND4]|uniref:AAA family ATPase n=1 Tax=Vibrio sp. AND4 TaxID=314289 RepID=UPI00015EFBCC|nr:AAA family ATPase [Vibrio sp. AND4]EDP60101.1 putative capsular polysaccharide biosynthesis [Vibrio sp. AND4]
MTIPATHAEIEQIYLQSELKGYKSICVLACQSEDGLTSIASAIAERLILAGHRTLYVDLNLFKPAYSTVHAFNEDSEEVGQLIAHKEDHQILVGLTAPVLARTQLTYRDPAMLRRVVDTWLEQYDRVVIDTSPILSINRSNIPAQVVAGVCNACVLVACYGSTTTKQITQAKALLDTSNANLLGAVLNMKHHVSLKDELIIRINKLSFISETLKAKISQQIRSSELFTL